MSSGVHSFETELLARDENLAGLAAINREVLTRVEAMESPRRVVPRTARVFSPGGGDVGEVEGVAELAVGTTPGVGDQIDFCEAGVGDVPAVGLDGDGVFEQGTGLGASVEATAARGLARLETTVDGAGADLEELAFEGRCEGEALADPGQPEGSRALRRIDQG
jgi:hypothetical protein